VIWWLLLLAVPCSAAEPKWHSIADQAFQYFRFWNDGGPRAMEQANYDRGNPHPPWKYSFYSGPVAQRTTCQLLDRAEDSGIGGDGPVYWYTPEGVHLDHAFATPAASEYNVSSLQTDMKGFAVTASFSGAAKGNGTAMEIAYYTNRACSDAGVEYGFGKDLATNSVLVYWSTFANCGTDVVSVCRRSDAPGLGDGFSNVQQEDAKMSDHGFRIYGLDPNGEYTYRMSVAEQAFHVEVLQRGHLAQCSEFDGRKPGPCTFSKGTGSWYPIDRLGNGYIVIGTQSVGNPVLSEDAGLRVNDVSIAK
jgi:hypothetical protein